MWRISIGALGTTGRFLLAALLAGTSLGVLTVADSALAADRAAIADTNDAPAAEAERPRRAVRQGTLLVAAQEGAPWRVLSRSEELPVGGVLRVVETAPVALAWDGATLTADAGARLATNSDGALVVVEGRIYFDAAPDARPCSIRAADVAIEIPAGAALELSLDDDNDVRAIATRAPGADQPPIKATAAGLTEPVEIAPGFAFSYGPEQESRTYLPLADVKQEFERVAAWTATGPTIGLGQLVVNDPETQRAERLNIARSHVNVVLAPPVALVQLDQSFYNPQPRTREGTFVFNLPRGASVSRFAMYVDASTLVEGELIDRRRAADVYDRIVRGQRDPAILEQLGDNLFRMRVFPIFGRDVKRILLDFTLPLAAADGRCRFELPLLTDLEPIWDFRVTGTVRGVARPESVVCRAFPELASQAAADHSVRFEFARQNFQPSAPLDIEFPLAEPRESTVRSYAAEALPPRAAARANEATDASEEDGDNRNPAAPWRDPWAGRRANYFLATLPALDAPRPAEAEPPADVLILADTSGATAPQESVRQAVRTVVGYLRPADRFPRLGALDADAQLGPLTRLDRRPTPQPRAADLGTAVTALERHEWDAAIAALDTVLAAAPDRPLPLFLKAWCHEQHGQPLPGADLVATLSKVTASTAVELTRLIASGTPGYLNAAERYAVLSAQPENLRSHDDWAHLAHWAMESGKREEALAYIDRSLDEQEIAPAYRFARELLRVEILLALDRGELVGQYVTALVDNRQADPDQLSHVADLLVHFGHRDDAEKLFTAALAREGLPADQRYGLLIARAACQVGLARWRSLLEAELSLPGDAPQQGVALASVLGELQQPIDAEVAAQLAAAFDQPRVHWPLVMRQAELTFDAAAAGELWWRVYQSGHIPDDKLHTACVKLNEARQNQRVVDIVEDRIRQRDRRVPDLLPSLEVAYRSLGRAADARRAASNFQELSAEWRWQQALGNRSARSTTGRGTGRGDFLGRPVPSQQ